MTARKNLLIDICFYISYKYSRMNTHKVILAIEDEKQLTEVYLKKFEELGIEVVIAKTGKEALTLAKQIPNLIILDIMLPGGMNGFDILKLLKQDTITSQIPVIILTNLDNEIETAKELGVVDYIIKSNTPIEKVVEKVRQVLNI
jgi:CheY-like chemotaxis protein